MIIFTELKKYSAKEIYDIVGLQIDRINSSKKRNKIYKCFATYGRKRKRVNFKKE